MAILLPFCTMQLHSQDHQNLPAKWQNSQEFVSQNAKIKVSVPFGEPTSSEYKQKFKSAASNLLDSIYIWNWDTLSNVWKLTSSILYTYDTNNYTTSCLSRIYDGSLWDDATQDLFMYDGNGNMTSWRYQKWNGVFLENFAKQLLNYDRNNNLISQVTLAWDGVLWINIARLIHTYDVDNNQTSGLQQTGDGNAWVNVE